MLEQDRKNASKFFVRQSCGFRAPIIGGRGAIGVVAAAIAAPGVDHIDAGFIEEMGFVGRFLTVRRNHRDALRAERLQRVHHSRRCRAGMRRLGAAQRVEKRCPPPLPSAIELAVQWNATTSHLASTSSAQTRSTSGNRSDRGLR